MELEIRTSGIWQLSSVVLTSKKACVVIDPAYFPRELAELRALAKGSVEAVVFTHGHWDHVMGWRTFPEARVYASPSLSRKDLASAQAFDGEWYVERPDPYAWPNQIAALAEGATYTFGAEQLDALSLPGHSVDGLALVSRKHGLLICGDYLSPCEIPFVESIADYQATLRRLIAELDALERVIPGHGPVLSRKEALAIARADLAYLDALAAKTDPPLPRARDVPKMLDHHRANLRLAGLTA